MNPHRKPRHRWEVAPVRPDLAEIETRQWPLPGGTGSVPPKPTPTQPQPVAPARSR